MVLESRMSSHLLHRFLRGPRCVRRELLRSSPHSRSCSSPFHALSRKTNSSNLYHGEASPSHQQESWHTPSNNPKHSGGRQHLHRHHDGESRYEGKNPIHSMHQTSTKRVDLRHQLAGFHSQGHDAGHGSCHQTLTNSIMRHSSRSVRLDCEGRESSYRTLANSIMRRSYYYRNTHVGIGRLAVCRRILSCGNACNATVPSGLPRRSSSYSSSSVQVEDEPVLELFQEEVSPESQLESLLTDPKIRSYSQEQVSCLISFLNARGLAGYTIVKRCPILLNYTFKTLEKKLRFLEGLGMDPKQMSSVLARKADRTVVGLSLVNLQNHVQFLKDIGVHDDEIKWVFIREPRFVFLNIKQTLYRTLSVYIEAGLSMEAFCSMASSQPVVFVYSRQRLLLEMSRISECSKALEKETMLSIYESRYAFLLSLGLSKEDLYRMCKANPRFILLKEGSMEQKIEYLTKVLNRDVRELITYPDFLCLSLENRIIPRFKRIDELSKRGLLKEQPALSTVLRCRTSEFERRYALVCAKTESESSQR